MPSSSGENGWPAEPRTADVLFGARPGPPRQALTDPSGSLKHHVYPNARASVFLRLGGPYRVFHHAPTTSQLVTPSSPVACEDALTAGFEKMPPALEGYGDYGLFGTVVINFGAVSLRRWSQGRQRCHPGVDRPGRGAIRQLKYTDAWYWFQQSAASK